MSGMRTETTPKKNKYRHSILVHYIDRYISNCFASKNNIILFKPSSVWWQPLVKTVICVKPGQVWTSLNKYRQVCLLYSRLWFFYYSSFCLLASLQLSISRMGVTSTLVETVVCLFSDLCTIFPLLKLIGAGVTITEGGCVTDWWEVPIMEVRWWLLCMTSSRSTTGIDVLTGTPMGTAGAGVKLTVTDELLVTSPAEWWTRGLTGRSTGLIIAGVTSTLALVTEARRLAATDIGSCNWGWCIFGCCCAFVGVTVTAELGKVILLPPEVVKDGDWTWWWWCVVRGCVIVEATVEAATEVGMAANIRLTLPPSVVKYVVVEAFLKKKNK